jgi:hypothetical protein
MLLSTEVEATSIARKLSQKHHKLHQYKDSFERYNPKSLSGFKPTTLRGRWFDVNSLTHSATDVQMVK